MIKKNAVKMQFVIVSLLLFLSGCSGLKDQLLQSVENLVSEKEIADVATYVSGIKNFDYVTESQAVTRNLTTTRLKAHAKDITVRDRIDYLKFPFSDGWKRDEFQAQDDDDVPVKFVFMTKKLDTASENDYIVREQIYESGRIIHAEGKTSLVNYSSKDKAVSSQYIFSGSIQVFNSGLFVKDIKIENVTITTNVTMDITINFEKEGIPVITKTQSRGTVNYGIYEGNWSRITTKIEQIPTTKIENGRYVLVGNDTKKKEEEKNECIVKIKQTGKHVAKIKFKNNFESYEILKN